MTHSHYTEQQTRIQNKGVFKTKETTKEIRHIVHIYEN